MRLVAGRVPIFRGGGLMPGSDGYYLSDVQSDAEFARLTQQAELYLGPLKARLLDLGLAPGARCLEIGPGSGVLVRWLVSQGASVEVLDISDRWFDSFRHPQVTAMLGDVRSTDVGSDFDFVVCQWVLHHLPEREAVVARLASALRRGGWLVVNEPDITGTWTAGGSAAFASFHTGMIERFTELGVDYRWGARAPGVLRKAGLARVDAGMWTPLVAHGCGGAQQLAHAWPVLCGVAVARGWYSAEELAAAERELSAPELVAGVAPCVLCWGQRPV